MKTLTALYPPMLVGLVFLSLSLYEPLFIIGVPVMIMDTLARHDEYKLLLSDYKYKHRYALRMGDSWCGRTAAVAALPEMKFIYYRKGYRWYNVLPDGFPLIFTKLEFWNSVLGLSKIVKNK